MVSKAGIAVAATIILLLSLGCGHILDRPVPSREDYLVQYLEYFDTTQIEQLDYVYQGAIGGAMTVGRAKFKGPVKVRDFLVEARLKSGILVTGTYDPAEMETDSALEFHRLWEVHAGGAVPPWFDFPFNRKMRTLRESREGSDGIPRYEKTWYIDDDRHVVYVRGNWG